MTKEEWLQEIEEQTLEELLSLGQTTTTELFDDPTSIITEIDYTTQHWLHCRDWIPRRWNRSDDWSHWRECWGVWFILVEYCTVYLTQTDSAASLDQFGNCPWWGDRVELACL